ncbi:putative iron-regulated membrane protein [Nonomuraea thailandensis]|uniref:Iron-regulated membrane protein n=1 Tax=Nonomuraea thailandensis TaxID=1188745 RepID=A0A9X2K855_9ACTN|nr:PepSY domain-containing protein [Nonomuraea thailandensis]MCP2360491.1 putative iron-regulated membrane protein [Nonomuraea thailandensis]
MTSVETRPETALPAPAKTSSQRYRAVWRWHFYAGLFVAPILLVLAVTGSIYLFKEPFEEWRYQDVRTLAQPAATARPLSEQIAAAQQARPGTPVMSVVPPTSPDRTTRVILQGADTGPWAQGVSVYVDPGTATVVGQIDDGATFMRVVRTIHGELMSGTVGDRVVETAACWALILVATGTYLWWRGRRTRRKPARPGRGRLRRLHILTGLGGGSVVVFLVLSGLPWSGVWGDGLQRLQAGTGSTYPSADDYPHTSGPPLSGDLSTNPDAKVPWAAERLPVPPSQDAPPSQDVPSSQDVSPSQDVPRSPDGHAGHHAAHGVLQPGALPIENALAAAMPAIRSCPPAECDLKVLLPDGPQGVYTIVTDPRRDPSAAQTLHVDQYSGRVLVSYGWAEYGVLAKAVEQGVALHEGRRYGTANLIVMLGACLTIITLVVTGAWMWWKRRPRGRAGAPARTTDRRTTYGVIAVMAVLGVLFPLAGVTMVAVLLVDRLVVRRIPLLARVFG